MQVLLKERPFHPKGSTTHHIERMPDHDRWAILVRTTSLTEAELIVGLLSAHDIDAMTFDQQSSPYPQIGEIAVVVDRTQLITAQYILDERDRS